MKAIDLIKIQALNSDPKAKQQINFTATLDREGNTKCFSLLKKQKQPFQNFGQGGVKVFRIYFTFK